MSTSLKGRNRGRHYPLHPEQGKRLAETNGGESNGVMWGWPRSAHAQLRNPRSLTAPAQLLVSVRIQPPNVLVQKDMGVPSAPYRTHGGTCTLCATIEAALTT